MSFEVQDVAKAKLIQKTNHYAVREKGDGARLYSEAPESWTF